MGAKVHLHVYIFFPLFVLFQYKYLDIDLNATQQDLLVNHSKLYLITPSSWSILLPPSPPGRPQVYSPSAWFSFLRAIVINTHNDSWI